MMFDKNKFVVKGQKKMLSSKRTYEILDGDSGELLATSATKKGLIGSLLGMFLGGGAEKVQIRDKSSNAPLMTVQRKGLIFKKIQVLDSAGKVAGRYKAKAFSLSGGFHVYDNDGKHFADVKGKMLKFDYRFLTPDGAEIGSVSKSLGGMAKSLLTGADSYGIQIAPAYADNAKAKLLVLGAAIAIDALFKKGGGKGGDEGGGDE